MGPGVSVGTALFAAFVGVFIVIDAQQVGMKTIWIHSNEGITDRSPQAEPAHTIYQSV